MIVKNPTDNEISVQIKGNIYTVPAHSEIKGVPAEHAELWKTHTHTFIELKAETLVTPEVAEKEEEKDVKVEEVEVKEESVAEEAAVVEAPAAKPKKGKK